MPVFMRMRVTVFMMVFMVMTMALFRFFMRRVMCGGMQVEPRKRLRHHEGSCARLIAGSPVIALSSSIPTARISMRIASTHAAKSPPPASVTASSSSASLASFLAILHIS